MKMTFSKRLKELRLERNYTQSILSELSGIARSTISAYELDQRKPSYDNLVILSQVLRVNIDYLSGNSNKRFVDTTGISQSTYYKILALIEADCNNSEAYKK